MTVSKEDYLKIIYGEGGREHPVSNKTIAQALGVAPASVSEMLGKLEKQGLAVSVPYKGARLTSCNH